MACRAAGGGCTGDNQPHGRGVVLIFGGSVSPSASPPLGNGDKSDPSTADAGPSTPHMASWERRRGPQTPAGPRGVCPWWLCKDMQEAGSVVAWGTRAHPNRPASGVLR